MMYRLSLLIYSTLTVFGFIFMSCNNQDIVSTKDSEPKNIVKVDIDKPTRLMTGTRCGPPAGAKLTGDIRFNNEDPRGAEWTENWSNFKDKIEWTVEAAKRGSYEVALVYRCSKGSAGSTYKISCQDSKIEGVVRESVSPYFSNAWEEIRVNGILELPEGTSNILMQATHIPENANVVMDLFSLKLTPLSAKKKIQQDSMRAVNTRANTDWFVAAKYGLMVHWLPESTPPQGPKRGNKLNWIIHFSRRRSDATIYFFAPWRLCVRNL